MNGPILCRISDIIGILPIADAVQGKILRLTDLQFIAEYLLLQKGSAGSYLFLTLTVLICHLQNPAEFAGIKLRPSRFPIEKISVINSMAKKIHNKMRSEVSSAIKSIKIKNRFQRRTVLNTL